MKKIKNWLFLLGSILMFYFSVHAAFFNKHMVDRNVKTLVLQKIDEEMYHKGRHNGNQYWLILQGEGVIFDLLVDRPTYYQAKVGNYLWFDINDVDMDKYDNSWSAILIFTMIIGFVLTIAFMINIFEDITRK